jgi:tRNA threonylcarbamoyl adenosine modification protein (Sua5/YciO/YrdC/YwlC family)
MAQFFQIHPENPQVRLIRRAVEILLSGAVIVYPTDSSYAFGCQIGAKDAMERIRRIRRLDDKHHFTLVCRDLSEITTYAKIDNQAFRLLKALTPGPYTFIHEGTKQVPRRLLHPRRKAIGIRVPDNAICRALLAELDQPILSTTLMLPALTAYAILMGMLGGMFVGVTLLRIGAMQYLTQTESALDLRQVVIGLSMGLAFGVVVALTGCYYGLRCGRSSAAVGQATTKAGVSSIVLVVVVTAVFTVVLYAVGL